MPEDTRPIHKRFAGQYCMRSTIWIPEKDKAKHTAKSTHSFRLGFEGGLHPAIAEAIMALQTHQGKVTPEMIAQLHTMAETLKSKGAAT